MKKYLERKKKEKERQRERDKDQKLQMLLLLPDSKTLEGKVTAWFMGKDVLQGFTVVSLIENAPHDFLMLKLLFYPL